MSLLRKNQKKIILNIKNPLRNSFKVGKNKKLTKSNKFDLFIQYENTEKLWRLTEFLLYNKTSHPFL